MTANPDATVNLDWEDKAWKVSSRLELGMIAGKVLSLEQQAENRRIWVEALRSGRFSQARESLRDKSNPGQYCCLGVACEISGEAEWQWVPVYPEFPPPAGEIGHWKYQDSQVGLPKSVANYLGVQTATGEFEKQPDLMNDFEDFYPGTTSLTALNDRGMPFEKIADVIEAAPEGLFFTKEDEDRA